MPKQPTDFPPYHERADWRIGRLEIKVYFKRDIGGSNSLTCYYCKKTGGRIQSVRVVAVVEDSTNKRFFSTSHYWKMAAKRLKRDYLHGRVVCDRMICSEKFGKDLNRAIAAGERDEQKNKSTST